VSEFAEWTVEEAALAWFGALDCSIAHGPAIAMGQPCVEGPTYRERGEELIHRFAIGRAA